MRDVRRSRGRLSRAPRSLLVLALLASPLSAEEGSSPASAAAQTPRTAAFSPPSRIEEASRQALNDGLAYLSRRQSESVTGALPTGDADRGRNAPMGVTALGTLAFMAGGSSPGRGPFGDEVERGVTYLLEHADLSPESKSPGYISDGGDQLSRTHGHGFATLALAQAYGMSPRNERMRRTLEAAVRLIQTSQGAEGGWEYEPWVTAAHEGSVTICLVSALRAARNSGIAVDARVISHAQDYVQRLQKEDGTFRYQLGREDSSVALTAAAITTLNMAGRYDDTIIRSAIDAIWTGLARRRQDGGKSDFPFYERLYIAQAFWQLSDTTHFERWFEEERERIVREQRSDGSWDDPRHGSCYATAMNCLVLAIPEGVLPIFQR